MWVGDAYNSHCLLFQVSRLREQNDFTASQQSSVSLMSPTSTQDIDFVDTQDDFYVLSQ